jgi:hypothetical protein
VEKAVSEAELILDGSASVSVARHLTTKAKSPARRISFFLNPEGTDLVVLAEDKGRQITLDSLEGIYYRATATDERLKGHFGKDPGSVRYGRSCGDLSSLIPSYLVTMHAAIASHAIRSAADLDAASIRIWRCNPSTTSVTQVDIPVKRSARRQFGDWTLVVDSGLTEKMASLRLSKLPNETGGVLIGYRDIVHRTIYLLDTLPSPPDSEEWPTLYIRGSKGLLPEVNKLSALSGNNLEYIGEWHSHPAGYPTLPSSDDIQVFAWLTEHLDLAGYPAVMAIAGDDGLARWFLGQIVNSWVPPKET